MRRWVIVVLAIGVLAGSASSAIGVTRDVTIVGVTGGFDPSTVTVVIGDEVRWTNGDGIGHTTTQSGPLGLWASGPLASDERFAVTLSAAGTYPYRCSIHSVMSGRVRVPPEVGLLSNGRIRVVIASQPPQDAFVFDIQRRDGNGRWQLWKEGISRRAARFSPPEDGEYAFRARLRRESGGASLWSPAVSVTV